MYNSNFIKQNVFQFLESFSIINNSNSIDTIIGRYAFVVDKVSLFIENRSNIRYINDIQEAIDLYKETYYDKIINEDAIKLLLYPNIELLNEIYSIAIHNSIGRQLINFVDTYNTLKKDVAKSNRKNDFKEKIKISIIEITKNGKNTPSYNKVIENLNNIYNLVNEREDFSDLNFVSS